MAVFSKPLSGFDPKHRTPLLLALATVLLLRSRLVSGPKDALVSTLKNVTRKVRLSQEELDEAQQQLYVKNEDGSKSLLVQYRGRITKVSLILQL
jgi:ATP-binding cassette subfamily D (ALD) long-chain fatty acid import protein